MEMSVVLGFKMLMFTIALVDGSICNYSEAYTLRNTSSMAPPHIFSDPAFWQHFQHKVKLQSWKCNFSTEILFQNLDRDASLYKNDSILRKRRYAVLNWIKNDTLWINLVLGACKELSNGQIGKNSLQLQNVQMLEALVDFVEHLNCFYLVASEMKMKGKPVKPVSQDSSQIHDIDKLDPIMLVGYSERFEDHQATTVWDACVDHHTHINPHHQAHCLWEQTCSDEDSIIQYKDVMEKALSEMVCDKVSRRLQKNLNGTVSNDMWNVDLDFFKGLPQIWLDKALDIMENMKNHR